MEEWDLHPRHFAEALAVADQGRVEEETLSARRDRYRRSIARSGAELDEATVERRASLMTDAVAQARFYVAEAQFERFAAIVRPPFSPSRTIPAPVRAWWVRRDGLAKVRSLERGFRSLPPAERLRWVTFVQFEHWFVTWTEERGAARERATERYLEASREGVPGWEIAAAARVGDMFRSEMQANLDVPIPEAVAADPDLLETYRAALDRRADDFRELAIGAYLRCLRVSTRTRWFDEWSRHCERNLSGLSPRDFPVADELRSGPEFVGDALSEPEIIDRPR